MDAPARLANNSAQGTGLGREIELFETRPARLRVEEPVTGGTTPTGRKLNLTRLVDDVRAVVSAPPSTKGRAPR